jgi:hypothetical protein
VDAENMNNSLFVGSINHLNTDTCHVENTKMGSCTSLLYDGSDKSIVYESAWVMITKEVRFSLHNLILKEPRR